MKQNRGKRVASIRELNDGNPWFFNIKNFIEKGTFPEYASASDKKDMKRMTLRYMMVGSLLYQRSFSRMLLRCLDDLEKRVIINQVHNRVCSGHVNTQMLAKKINRIGYWPTMEEDCLKLVRKYVPCQIYGDKINAPSSSFHPLTSPWPLFMWAFNVVGPLRDTIGNTNRQAFILTSTGYFTK